MARKAKRNYKDSLFCKYIGLKENLADVCRSLEFIGEVNPVDIKITTLKNVLYSGLKNDISLQIKNSHAVLMEHQSSLNANITLRMLWYNDELLKKYVPRKLIYSQTPIKLPAPHFYVFYNGQEEKPEQYELKLSDNFIVPSSALELTATVFNINYDKSKSILQKSQVLHDYSFFVDKVRGNMKEPDTDLNHAIKDAMDYCIANDVMAKFLSANYGEVFDMVCLQWNQEDAIKYAKDESAEQEKISNLRSIIKNMKLSVEQAMNALDIPTTDQPRYAALLKA